MGFPGGSDSKESTCNAGDLGSVPGLGRSPGGAHGNPLQYSCLENPRGQRSLAGEKNHVVPTYSQDDALARDGVSREVPCSALKGETVPDSLPATPKSPPTRRVPPRGGS